MKNSRSSFGLFIIFFFIIITMLVCHANPFNFAILNKIDSMAILIISGLLLLCMAVFIFKFSFFYNIFFVPFFLITSGICGIIWYIRKDACEKTVLSKVYNSSNTLYAEITQRSCGSTTGYAYSILIGKGANIFKREKEIFTSYSVPQPFSVSFVNDSSVNIFYGDRSGLKNEVVKFNPSTLGTSQTLRF
jgi:hypothetical protein